jgi:hypothetical protein
METNVVHFPTEILVNILTFLRAYDLSAVHQTCRTFASKFLVHNIIKEIVEHVYPPELTDGFKLDGSEYTFESLRNMEWLVVARVLSRPEPPAGGFYVSKSWCKTALKWLEFQQEEQKTRAALAKQKKVSKKKLRVRNRRLSDANPPWPNVNSDLVCCHDKLQHAQSTRNARGRRRLIDKQAWKVLKKLYPDSVSLDTESGECIQCRLELEAIKLDLKQKEDLDKERRRKPLSCQVIRGIYTRTRGVPIQSMIDSGPLKPGLYHVLPKVWLYNWRRYLKTGEGEAPRAPDASNLLCYEHNLPLIPPHLESYLYGETSHLWECAGDNKSPILHLSELSIGLSPVDVETWNALRAAGVSQQELESQRALSIMNSSNRLSSPRSTTKSKNEQLDIENSVVVEILTDEEYSELEKLWPDVQPSYDLRFTIDQEGTQWSSPICRACDPSSRNFNLAVSHSSRAKKMSSTKKSPISNFEY